jgi:RNA polymerase sigma-70 factor (ECF subfamily)
MAASNPEQHLSQIATLWSIVNRAGGQENREVTAARQRLLQRYGGAVQRYLLGALRDAEAADELTQEFALRFMDGKYKGADRERGRFRNFIKGVLSHLIADHFRRLQSRPRPLPLDGENLSDPGTDPADPDPLFVENWRQALLGRAWQLLADVEAETGQPFHTVLRLRVDQPELRSPQMAELVSARLGRTVSAESFRQTLHRARDRFADLLLDEVAQTLGDAVDDDLEQELIELNLLTYCQDALGRRLAPKAGNRPPEGRGKEPPAAE